MDATSRSIQRGLNLIEYTEKDSKELVEALNTLISKCAKAKSYELNCIVSYGENLELDCHFGFKVHKED